VSRAKNAPALHAAGQRRGQSFPKTICKLTAHGNRGSCVSPTDWASLYSSRANFWEYHRAMSSPRRFPPPWSIEEYNEACFIVRDAGGQALAYFYFEEELSRRTAANWRPIAGMNTTGTAAEFLSLKQL
jgi:hypothetical protein